MDTSGSNFETLSQDKNVDSEIKKTLEVEGPNEHSNYEQLITNIKAIYEQGAETVSCEPVVRNDESTLFTSSGIQYLYGGFLRNEKLPKNPVFINQPVIRTNYFHSVQPDSYTSFVNPGVFKVNASEREHNQAKTKLISLIEKFSSNSKLDVVEEESVSNWSEDLQFPVLVSHITLNGLEVADAVFAPIVTTASGQLASISEFGLGRERIYYAREGQGLLDSIYGIEIDSDNIGVIDAIRTATLMAGNGVVPSSNNHGYQLRRFSKRIASENIDDKIEISKIISQSYSFWDDVVSLPETKETTSRIICHEVERNQGLALIQELSKENKTVPKVDVTRGLTRTLAALKNHGLEMDSPRLEISSNIPERTLVVCDYDNVAEKYTFPNFHLGSSENRIWHFAKSATEIPGIKVIITGPRWLPEHVPGALHFPQRLSSDSTQRFLAEFGKADYLFAGHEYFDKPEWTKPFKICADNLISYQLHPYEYKRPSFNARDSFLFCYSDEMMETYKDQKPIKSLLFHSGVGEEPRFDPNPNDQLVWMGRMDAEKAPHIAIAAARLLNKKIVMMGETVREPAYGKWLQPYLTETHVETTGILRGEEKMRTIAASRCGVYTVSAAFSEAGAGVLGEYLRSGVPIAGISWKGNDAVCEAVNTDPSFGRIIDASKCRDEDEIAKKLSFAIQECLEIDREKTYKYGNSIFDARKLVEGILNIVLSRSSVSQKFNS